jgi:hypothetical protein
MTQNQPVGVAGLGALLDFGFQKFITLSVIKVLYVLGIAAIGLALIAALITAFTQGGAATLAVLIIAPLFALVYLIFLRVWLELVVVIFKIGEHTGKLVQQGEDAVASLTKASE